MLRKKRQVAPNFRMPGAPFNPATGQHAALTPFPAKGTTLGFFQVIGDDPADPDTADTHDNYVVCRGYESESDPEHQFLHDPYTHDTTTPINVAKPYGVRGTFPYVQGQVIVAARIRNKLGYNAGKAVTTVGQPEDLDELIGLLTDDAGVGIAWLDIGTSQQLEWIGKTAGIAKGAAGLFTVWDKSTGVWAATAEAFQATALGAAIPANKYATAMEYRGQKICAPWEC